MNQHELNNVLGLHRKWLMGDAGGVRADLGGADLRFANLSGANLSGVNLREANLGPIKADFFEVLTVARSEVLALYEALSTGKINGSVYVGECACLVGTIANARHENPYKLSIALIPQPLRAAERWFLAIRAGDIPMNNPVSAITADWMREFMDKEGITYPRYEIRAVANKRRRVKK